MNRINYYLILLLSIFTMVSCGKEPDQTPEEQKDQITLGLKMTNEITGIGFRSDSLLVSNEGVESIDLKITNSENMSLNSVDFKYTELENTYTKEEWYTISMSGDNINIAVSPAKKSKEKYRSAKINIEGMSEKYEIIPATLTIHQATFEKNKACWIDSFTIEGQTRDTDIYLDNVVVVHMAYGTDVTNLTPTIKVSDKATCDPASGVAQDFTEPVVYRVTSENGNFIDWRALVELDPEPKHEAEMLDFSVDGILDKATISENTVNAIVKEGTDVSALRVAVSISEGATVNPKSGDIVDFTKPVEFTVTAEDGTTKNNYTVSVITGGTCELVPEGDLAEGVSLSNGTYTVPVEGSGKTSVKAELHIGGKKIYDYSRYEINVEAIDMTGNTCSWVTTSTATDGIFTFSTAANSNENVRRSEIIVSVKDNQGQQVFGTGSLQIVQNGTSETSELVEMIAVKGGRYKQGDCNDASIKPEMTRWCNLSDFYIGKYEITQSQFEAVMGFNPSTFPLDGANHPVETVTFWDAMMFCDKLSEREGYSTFYNLTDIIYVDNQIVYAKRNCNMEATGYRLPTLAEWEYAAKGGEDQINEHLYTFAGCDRENIKDYAWFDENNGEKPAEVGTKLANNLGIHDMSGNVSEWCHDWRYDRHIGMFPSEEEVYDPFGPEGPSTQDYFAMSQGGYYGTYDVNLNVVRQSFQWGDIGINDANHMCVPSAFGFRIARRK